MECLFSLMELEKLYAGNPGLYNLRGACYIEIRNIEKALENFEKPRNWIPPTSPSSSTWRKRITSITTIPGL